MVLARVTVNQVTKHTGYSQSFVSLVLNHKVALTMKAQQKIEKAIKELGE